MSSATIAAVSCVLVTNRVGRVEPFHSTVAPGTKFVPVVTSVNDDPPAVTTSGLSEVTAGVGLLTISVAVLLGSPGPVSTALTASVVLLTLQAVVLVMAMLTVHL